MNSAKIRANPPVRVPAALFLRPYRLWASCLATAMLLSACGGRGVDLEQVAAAGPPLFWPAPPEVPRIRYLFSIQRPLDVGARRSFFRRILNAVIGGGEDRGIRQPYGLAVDSTGRIHVADPGARGVHIFDPFRRRYTFHESAGDTDFQSPIGVAIGANGILYVSDSQLRIVTGLDESGKERVRIEDGLLRPTGLAFHATTGQLYVVDTHQHRVVVYSADGTRQFTFGERGTGTGQFNYPTNIWLSEAGGGEVYVTDALNFRVQIFGLDGTYRTGFGRHGDAVGDLARPKGLATDRHGHVYVVEGLHDVVNIYNRDGRLLLSFGGAGRGRGEFWLATGLTVDERDRIYVADSYNGRVQVFQYLPEAAP